MEKERKPWLAMTEGRSIEGYPLWPQGSTANGVVYPLLHEIAPQPPSDVVYPLLSELNPQPSSDVVYPLLSELNPQPSSDVVYPLLSELNPQPSSDVVYPLLHELRPQPPSDVVYPLLPRSPMQLPFSDMMMSSEGVAVPHGRLVGNRSMTTSGNEVYPLRTQAEIRANHNLSGLYSEVRLQLRIRELFPSRGFGFFQNGTTEFVGIIATNQVTDFIRMYESSQIVSASVESLQGGLIRVTL